ncbi:hypothetical protein A3E20_02765 [Candidatus Saccharibacteria bacterium RIFCSPHIGHO2_12_FULL_47_16]|nr:MAG: hypothetical protein A3E20_02765 [Candidatus Saccharibacteria bacterium RIFCSPHIGHO2_12_FULL_47_16]
MVKTIEGLLDDAGYEIVEINDEKPWGAYFRLANDEAPKFIKEFFPGLSLEDAQLGRVGAELSPKILLVSPGERLSWQYHDRRAERWAFISSGSYNKSMDDNPGNAYAAQPGDVVQFSQSERHRLVGENAAYTVVAEVWQHTNINQQSDENDIVRLIDDYQR